VLLVLYVLSLPIEAQYPLPGMVQNGAVDVPGQMEGLCSLIQAGKDMLLVDFVNLLLWALNGMTTSSRVATL
jgi:hypothetical protein